MSEKKESPTQWERPKEFKLINAYDDLVRTAVQEMMDSTDMCKCERCYLDACAIVFNQKYTHFVNTREGDLLRKVPSMNHSNRVELMVTVMNALKLVKDFPHHDVES